MLIKIYILDFAPSPFSGKACTVSAGVGIGVVKKRPLIIPLIIPLTRFRLSIKKYIPNYVILKFIS
jgi:hypothetical protein